MDFKLVNFFRDFGTGELLRNGNERAIFITVTYNYDGFPLITTRLGC